MKRGWVAARRAGGAGAMSHQGSSTGAGSRSALAAWDTIAARLVRPFALALPAMFAYWIVCPKPSAKLPKIAAFTDWLLAEAADDVRRLEKLRSKSHAG